jgi:hypothetical protein
VPFLSINLFVRLISTSQQYFSLGTNLAHAASSAVLPIIHGRLLAPDRGMASSEEQSKKKHGSLE